MELLFWSSVLRFTQSLLAGAPTLLVGVFIAAVFRHLLGPSMTARVFGGNTWRSLPQAWLWGMLLPVCSLGTIPIAYEMRRAGLRGGAILGFVLTAPLFNPLSLLYGLTLSSPSVIFCFVLASLVVVTAVGLFWDACFPHTEGPVQSTIEVPPGIQRIAIMSLVAMRHMANAIGAYVLLGLLGNVLLAGIIPFGSLSNSMAHTDPWAPLQMMLIATPAYATPLNIMGQVGGMFVHGNSVGAAFVLLALGTGANLGIIAWASHNYGLFRAAVFMATFVAVVLLLGYAMEEPLYTAGHVDHPHTHAFDVYGCPFPNSPPVPYRDRVWTKLRDEAKTYELLSVYSLLGLLIGGIAISVFDRTHRLEMFVARSQFTAGRSVTDWLNQPVSNTVLGLTAIVGLIAISVAGCYIYFPPPEQTLADMRYVKADALSFAASRDVEQAVKHLDIYDDLTRRLQVGYYLRVGGLSEFQQARARALRNRLEQLKDHLESHEFMEVRQSITAISNAHRRVREVFCEKGS